MCYRYFCSITITLTMCVSLWQTAICYFVWGHSGNCGTCFSIKTCFKHKLCCWRTDHISYTMQHKCLCLWCTWQRLIWESRIPQRGRLNVYCAGVINEMQCRSQQCVNCIKVIWRRYRWRVFVGMHGMLILHASKTRKQLTEHRTSQILII